MRIINKKYLLIIILVGVILTGVIVFKPEEDAELYEVKLQDDNKKDLAIMLEQLDNSYKEYNKIPYKGYTLNEEMTKCIDNNGNELEKEITYENGTITVSTNRTIYCYLYFDIEEKIEDLSGKGNHGKNYAVEWTEEGITTSTKEEKGYVDCGLAKYNFQNTITMITRVKFNNLAGLQDFFGNWEGAGCGLSLDGTDLKFELYIDKRVSVKRSSSLNTYYTVVGVYNGSVMSLYINGQKVNSQEMSGNIKQSNMPIFLGANPESSAEPRSYSYTTFTDALIFDTALTEEEIKENFSGEIDKDKVLNKYVNTESDQKLLLYYKFD